MSNEKDYSNEFIVSVSNGTTWRYQVVQRKGGNVAGWYNFKIPAIIKAKQANRKARKNTSSCAEIIWEPRDNT